VAKRGFDWPDIKGPRDKILEELEEIDSALTHNAIDDVELEMGDLLFSVVNYSRHLGVNPALALGRSNRKFEKRFKSVEMRLRRKCRGILNR